MDLGKNNPSEAEIMARLDAYGVCASLRSSLRSAARERAVKEFNIAVTPEEEAAERAKMITQIPPNAQQQMQDMADLVPPALADVAQGKDPQQVYTDYKLAEHGIDPQTWLVFQRMPNAKTAEGRAKIRQQYLNGVVTYQNPAAGHYDAAHAVRMQKLDAAVDQKLAASDPQFATDLREFDAAQRHLPVVNYNYFTQDKMDYLAQKRAQFWAQETTKLNVNLSDPSLKAKCGL